MISRVIHCGILATLVLMTGGQRLGKSYSSNDPTVKYAQTQSTPLPVALQKLLNASVEAQRGGMTGAPEVVSLNMLLIKAINGKKVLDVGLFGGFGAVGAALAIPADGKVIGMDVSDQNWNQIGRQFAEEAGVLSKIDVRIKPANETMKELISSGQRGAFDFCFIDADKDAYDTYYEQCLSLLRAGGIITLDNVLRGGRVVTADPSDQSSLGILNRLNKKIAEDPRVYVVMLPIADGLTMVLKK